MKNILYLLVLVSLLVMQIASPAIAELDSTVLVKPSVADESVSPAMREFMVEGSLTRGSSTPTSKGTLPYTGEWNSVIEYTNTNKYFTGYSTYKVTLDVWMNYANTPSTFKVYMVNKATGKKTSVINSVTARQTYKTTSTIHVAATSDNYYFRFEKSGTRSCGGTLKIAKG